VSVSRQQRVRLGVLLIAMTAFFVLILFRLAQLQIIKAGSYNEIVQRQSGGKVAIPAERGMIYDRHGRLVAKNVNRSSLYAHPESKRELRQVAAYLEGLFSIPSGTASGKYRLEPNRFRWITRHLDDRTAGRVAKEAPRGLYLRSETRREYPFKQVGKQILGFTSIDSEGLSGFELARDSMLAGKSGWADIRRDGLRNTFRVKETALVKPVPGASVVLTVDWHLQEIVEEELREAVIEYNAESGLAAFVDCNSGDILSMAHYDPNEKDPSRPVKLRAISDQFEPGSAFKPFTAACLLDAGLVNYTDTVYCEMGKWRVGRRTLHDDKELGWLTFREIIELSSNIGLGKCAVLAEGEDLLETYHNFGFGRKADCGLPGEISGMLPRLRTVSDYNISALAMGHSVAVNALQMALALAAIANGGELLEPHLMLGTVEDNGYVNRTARRTVISRPVKRSSADSLRSFMRGVVEHGTGKPVNSEFVSIAGKTGTGEIPNLESGGYYKNRFTASFCGFFPADAPVIAGIVVLENPKPITYGGHTSGKAFRKIAERYTVSNPDLFEVTERTYSESPQRLEMTSEVPDLVGRDLIEAQRIAEKRGVKLRCSSAEGTVTWQFPPPDRLMLLEDELLVEVDSSESAAPVMMDLRGLTIRKASAWLNHHGIRFTIDGTGRITKQSVRPGQSLTSTPVCRLTCRSS